MSEEEKKAIEMLEIIVDECKLENKRKGYEGTYYDGDTPIPYKEYEIVLKLITRLKKESKDKDNKVRKIINRLDNDYKRITETKSDGKHWDDYSKCRLKAYRTKTKEIKEYIEKQYFETKAKGEYYD